MRRKDREVRDMGRIREIINACHCCRLGLWDGERVYIVPLHFGYEEVGERRVLYFHGAAEGRKIELIKRKPLAGFEMDARYECKEAAEPCGYSARFQSVIGTGRVELMDEPVQKAHALGCVMRHLTGRDGWTFPADAVAKTAVFRLEVEELSCKEQE